jgi:hypothetical protein
MKTSLLAGTSKLPIVIVTVLGSFAAASTEPVVPLPEPPAEMPPAPASALVLVEEFPPATFPLPPDPPLDDDPLALLLLLSAPEGPVL